MQERTYQPFSPNFISHILQTNGLWLSKNRGQNYLVDRAAAEKIVSAVPEGSFVFEVGSGLGALTCLLAQKFPTVSIELDGGIYRLLRVFLEVMPNLKLENADFLKYDLNALPEEKYYFVSNLPYSISGEAIKVFIDCPKFSGGVVMLQAEFVERMLAGPSEEGYGVLSILCQTYLEIEPYFTAGRKLFFPPPTVDSAVVILRKKISSIPQEAFNLFLRTAFRMRRKTLNNNLKDFGITKEMLSDAGFRADARPEEIKPVEWQSMFLKFFDKGR